MASNMYIPIAFKSDPRGLKKAESQLDVFKKTLKGVGVAGAAAVAGIGLAMFKFGEDALKAAVEAERINRSLEQAVINSGKFGKTSEDVKKVTKSISDASTALAEVVGIDDEVISGVKRSWLSVGNISRRGIKGLNKLALVAADVAGGTGKNFEEVANAFTKAFGDPKGAIAKLQRAGVILNQQEKERYQLLIKQGKEQDALSYLQDTLAKKFKGQGQAAASPFERLQIIWQNFLENVGTAFLPILNDQLPQIAQFFKDLVVDPKFKESIDVFAQSVKETMPTINKFIVEGLPVLTDTLRAWVELTTGFPTLRKEKELQDKALKLQREKDAQFRAGSPGALPGKSPMIVNMNVTIPPGTPAQQGKEIARALDAYYNSGGGGVWGNRWKFGPASAMKP